MIYLKPMSELEFEKFKSISQKEYANNFSAVEGVELEAALKSAAEQFSRLAPEGLQTLGQLFFEAIDEKLGISIGYLWLGIQERMGRKVTSINDIIVNIDRRGQGFGKALIACIEIEAKKVGSSRVRLHVFHHNEVARNLYISMGFQPTSIDMVKLLVSDN